MEHIAKNDILIVIVLYNQKLSESIAFNSLNDGNESFLIYDNSNNIKEKKEYNLPNVKYVRDESNPGLSFAYNYAAFFAKNNGYNWLLLSDQDTLFPKNAIGIYRSAISNYPGIKLFMPKIKVGKTSYFSPVPLSHYCSNLSRSVHTGLINPQKYAIINSGLLVNVNSFFEVGGYNDKVKLDFSDFQFIDRFATIYNKAFVIDLTCIQNYSDLEHSIDKKINRFEYYCTSAKAFRPNSRGDRIWLNIAVTKRMLSLCRQSKSLSPFLIYLKYFLL